jgi:hypothetical protein
MQTHYFPAVCQANTGSVILIAVMQSLEDDENFFKVFLINANAVVLNGKEPLLVEIFG